MRAGILAEEDIFDTGRGLSRCLHTVVFGSSILSEQVWWTKGLLFQGWFRAHWQMSQHTDQSQASNDSQAFRLHLPTECTLPLFAPSISAVDSAILPSSLDLCFESISLTPFLCFTFPQSLHRLPPRDAVGALRTIMAPHHHAPLWVSCVVVVLTTHFLCFTVYDTWQSISLHLVCRRTALSRRWITMISHECRRTKATSQASPRCSPSMLRRRRDSMLPSRLGNV